MGLALAAILVVAGSAAGGNASTQALSAASVAAGGWTGCAVTTTATAYCWGSNREGQAGNGSRTNQLWPLPVSGLGSSVASISVGDDHTCAVTTTGGAKCWGPNGFGQLGDGTENESTTPVDVTGLASGVREVSVGYVHACALTDAGGVLCWGDNTYGELVSDFALAGTHVAWADYDYGNEVYCSLVTASLARPRAHDTNFCSDFNPGTYIGDFAGGGSLLVFNSWGNGAGVWSLAPDGSAKELVTGAAAGKVRSADAGRFALREPSGAIDVYAAKATLIRHFGVVASNAKLDGPTLVVQEGDTLRSYDAFTGAVGSARTMTGGKAVRLDGVAGGIAAYTVGGTIHLLRLSDGKRAAINVPRTGRAYADITSAGLFYGAGRTVTFRPTTAVRGLLR